MTPEGRPQEIIRTEDIVVDSSILDKYGNLVVLDKGGNEHRVSAKRKRLFDIFQEGVAVHLCYASYMNKEYIADAVPVAQLVKPAIPKAETVAVNKGIPPPKAKAESKNGSYALAYAKDLIVALIVSGQVKELTPKVIGSIMKSAELFRQWLDGDIWIDTKFIASLVIEMLKDEPTILKEGKPKEP